MATVSQAPRPSCHHAIATSHTPWPQSRAHRRATPALRPPAGQLVPVLALAPLARRGRRRRSPCSSGLATWCVTGLSLVGG